MNPIRVAMPGDLSITDGSVANPSPSQRSAPMQPGNKVTAGGSDLATFGDGKRVTWWRKPLRMIPLAFRSPHSPPTGREFEELTGLHRVYSRFTWERRIIREQAETIRNLRAERDGQRKAYQRKIAKLEQKLAAALPPDSARSEPRDVGSNGERSKP